jgi:hypothetical protein
MEGTLKRTMRRTTSAWATGVLDEFIEGESGPLLPIKNGKQMGIEQARRWWKEMI